MINSSTSTPVPARPCVNGHPRTPDNLRWTGIRWSCRPCNLTYGQRTRKRQRQRNPLRCILYDLARNAKTRKQDFSITQDDLLPLPTHCPVLGIELDYSGSRSSASASIDRTNSRLGYVPGNVVIMSMRANVLKSDGTQEEFRKVIEYLETTGVPNR